MCVIRFHIQVNDIYFWGTGFSPGVSEIWSNYFKKLNSPFWRVINEYSATFLVSVACGGMVHPLDGFTVCFEEEYEDSVVLEDLKRIFSDLADKCKTTWSYNVTVVKGG